MFVVGYILRNLRLLIVGGNCALYDTGPSFLACMNVGRSVSFYLAMMTIIIINIKI